MLSWILGIYCAPEEISHSPVVEVLMRTWVAGTKVESLD